MIAPRRIGIIGFGAIAKALLEPGAPWLAHIGVVGILRRRSDAATGTYPTCHTLDELLALKPELTVECAGHEALRTLGPRILAAGIDLLVVSTGALADAPIEAALRTAAGQGRSRVLLVAGAVGGLDALSAARHTGLSQVRYIGRKPPGAWRGTDAETAANHTLVSGSAAVVFEGSARQAALRYPQNANVAAAIALAGIGFDETQVVLFSDPGVSRNLHRIEAQGAFGEFHIELSNAALPSNPKTSRLTAGSLAGALSRPAELIVFA